MVDVNKVFNHKTINFQVKTKGIKF